MTKRFLSLALALVLIFSTVTTAFAATTKPAAKPKTEKERVAAIEEKYGIDVELTWHEYDTKPSFDKHLTAFENALLYLGTVFTKRLTKAYEEQTGRIDEVARFYVDLYAATNAFCLKYTYGIPVAAGSADKSGRLEISGNETNAARLDVIIHEFGHMMDYTLYDDTEYPAPFSSENYNWVKGSGGVNQASKYPDRFVTTYAQQSPLEDYAECFRAAIMGGAEAPLKYGKDSVIYKKTLIVYNDLVGFAGKDSVAAKRVAAYLGLKTTTPKK